MTNDEKFRLQRRTFLRSLWQSLSGTPDFPVKLVMAALYLIGAVYVCVRQAAWRTLAGNIPLLSPLLKAAMEHALFAYLLVGAAVLLALLLYPFGRRAAKDQLQCIGLLLCRPSRDAPHTIRLEVTIGFGISKLDYFFSRLLSCQLAFIKLSYNIIRICFQAV